MNPITPTTLLNMTESETFDFKSGQYKFYGGTDDEKSELLKDVIAFANAWKTGDAFIVIGVREKNGRKDAVVGVASPLKDNDIQQFINAKTNRPITFLVYSDQSDGQDINVIQIARDQQRPIFLYKAFGKLKPNEVHIRSGSSTAIASPDQIAEMVKADHQVAIAQANLDLEWVDASTDQRLGKEVTIRCVKLVDPPPRPPEPKPRQPEWMASASVAKSLLAQCATPVTRTWSLNTEPSAEEISEYMKARALLAPLRIWLKNLGLRNASSIKVRIHIPRASGVCVIDESDLPRKPGSRFLSALNLHARISFDTCVRESPEGWNVEIDAKTIQPQDEFCSGDEFYLSTESDQVVETTARIFADDLAKPIEIPLKINIEVKTREITLADLRLESEESE